MKFYDVLLSKILSARVQVEAENAEAAEDIAFERLEENEIELMDSGIPGDVNIFVSEIGVQVPSTPNYISIYWNDLTTAKRAEIVTAFGENCNYDVFPIVQIPIESE